MDPTTPHNTSQKTLLYPHPAHVSHSTIIVWVFLACCLSVAPEGLVQVRISVPASQWTLSQGLLGGWAEGHRGQVLKGGICFLMFLEH